MSAILPELLDVHRAALYLHISVSKLYELTRKKELRHYRNGRRILFSESMLVEFLEKSEVKPLEEARDG